MKITVDSVEDRRSRAARRPAEREGHHPDRGEDRLHHRARATPGCASIEAGAFVSPKWVPQMADTAEVYRNIPKDPGVEYPVLVPNMKGLERAIEAGVKSIAIFTAASETFNKRNINMSIDESFENYAPVAARARAEGMRVRGYVSTAFGCPYEGDVAPEKVLEVCARLLDLGCYEVSVGDTIGVGTPMQVQGVIGMLLQVIPASKLAMHFHDTRGTALANTLAALEMGIATFDASSGGLGGCPYAPGASATRHRGSRLHARPDGDRDRRRSQSPRARVVDHRAVSRSSAAGTVPAGVHASGAAPVATVSTAATVQ